MTFKNSTDEKFQEQISGDKLSLIQFSASWCGPCQQLKPIIEKISNEKADKVDISIGIRFQQIFDVNKNYKVSHLHGLYGLNINIGKSITF